MFVLSSPLARPQVGSIDANADGVVALNELGAHYGLLEPLPVCQQPWRILGVKLGKAKYC